MRFYEGMSCCNPFRESVGLYCGIGQQVACATGELQRLAMHAPASVPRFLRTLLTAFPDNPDWLLKAAQHAGVLDEFIECAALHCATFPTRTIRQEFRNRIAGYLNAAQLERFTQLLSAEWSRLRNITPGDSK